MVFVDKRHYALLALCVGSRLLTAIYYIEDTDSLRFALAVIDYDVTRLQPHFPGYPVFCYVVKLLYGLTGYYAIAFALVGGGSTYVIIVFLLRIGGADIDSGRGMLIVFLVFFNPLLWLMGNRYMADLMGVACMMAAFHYLTKGDRQIWGGLLVGVLGGIRLSYLPFLALPVLLLVVDRSTRKWSVVGGGVLGTAVWLVPLIGHTGWGGLVEAAQIQADGHFRDFGGTIITESDLTVRMNRLVEGILADGLGLFWAGRHWLTLVATLALCAVLVQGWPAVLAGRWREVDFRIKAASWAVYLGWIFMAQNVVYKSRHVLPLLPFIVLAIVEVAGHYHFNRRRYLITIMLFLLAHASVTAHLVIQHKRPTAIAQIKDYIEGKEDEPGLHVVAVPLVKYYLASQGVEAVYVTIEDETDLIKIAQIPADRPMITIGSPYFVNGRPLKHQQSFYHNPYVNRMWAEIDVYEY